MQTINFAFTFHGDRHALEMFAFSGAKYYSVKRVKRIKGDKMTLIYMTEDGDFDGCLDCIDLDQAESWGVELIDG